MDVETFTDLPRGAALILTLKGREHNVTKASGKGFGPGTSGRVAVINEHGTVGRFTLDCLRLA